MAIGYYCPSDDRLKGGSCASGNLDHGVMTMSMVGHLSGAGTVDDWGNLFSDGG